MCRCEFVNPEYYKTLGLMKDVSEEIQKGDKDLGKIMSKDIDFFKNWDKKEEEQNE